jgi:hypothetical protein
MTAIFMKPTGAAVITQIRLDVAESPEQIASLAPDADGKIPVTLQDGYSTRIERVIFADIQRVVT